MKPGTIITYTPPSRLARLLRAWANRLDPTAGLSDGEAYVRLVNGSFICEWPRVSIESIVAGLPRECLTTRWNAQTPPKRFPSEAA